MPTNPIPPEGTAGVQAAANLTQAVGTAAPDSPAPVDQGESGAASSGAASSGSGVKRPPGIVLPELARPGPENPYGTPLQRVRAAREARARSVSARRPEPYEPTTQQTSHQSLTPPQSTATHHNISTPHQSGAAQSAQQPDVVQALMTQVQALQTTIEGMRVQMQMFKSNGDGKGGDKRGGESSEDDIPYMNNKDIEKPAKYGGDKWGTWESDFKSFLTHRDRRWKDVLDNIKAKSKEPLNPTTIQSIRKDSGLLNPKVFEAFTQQLFEYLKSYTSGDVNTLIVANGPENSFESWRRICDQGRSIRNRPLRDEKRALYHPKQATSETLVKAIADWEKRLNQFVLASPEEGMDDPEKIMCLEDMCPEHIQRYLADKA